MLESHVRSVLSDNLKENFDYLFELLCKTLAQCFKKEPDLKTHEISLGMERFLRQMHSKIKDAETIAESCAKWVIESSFKMMKSGLEEKQMFVHQSPETIDVATDVPDFLFADFPLPREKINWMIRPKKRN